MVRKNYVLRKIDEEGEIAENIELTEEDYNKFKESLEEINSDFVRVNDRGQPEIVVSRIASEVADEIAHSLDLPEGDFVEIRDEIENRLGGRPMPLSTERLWLFGKEG